MKSLLFLKHVLFTCSILEELETHGEKVGHWAWWVFPTEKEGFSEPAPKSAVSYTTAPLLLQHAPPEWKLVLEKVLELSDASQGGIRRVLPAIDHDRVRYFALFWKEVADTPDVNAQWVRDLALKFEAAF